MNELRALKEMMAEHAKAINLIIERLDEQQEDLDRHEEMLLEDEYYTVEEYAESEAISITPKQARLLRSLAFQISHRDGIETTGDFFRIDVLEEVFEWSF